MRRWSRLIAKFRFKLFRLMSIVLLGREGGQSIIGQCVSSDLEFANTKAVRDRILERRLLSDPTIQNYNITDVPKCWGAMFLRAAIFPRRFAYLLKDVVIGPDSGVIFAPPMRLLGGDGVIFIQSVAHPYFFFQSGIQEVMRSARKIEEDLPVCPMPTIGYYHELYEGLLHIIKARKVFGDIRILLAKQHPRYVDEMLCFVGINSNQIIASDYPVQCKRGVLIPRWSDCGENLKQDIWEFRDALISKLSNACVGTTKLYISRARSRRSLPNESEIERILARQGYRIAYFEEMSFVEQLKAIRASKTIVAPHGAGLSNMIVAEVGTKVVEIMTQGWANSCYGHLAESLGLAYSCLDADEGCLMERIRRL